jgi:hypothetical protein
MQACAPLAVDTARASHSSLGCMRVALTKHPLDRADDAQAHCVAAGLIALHCSPAEAWLASLGKEVSDVFGRGKAELRDLRADRAGIRCAYSATATAGVVDCCQAKGERLR